MTFFARLCASTAITLLAVTPLHAGEPTLAWRSWDEGLRQSKELGRPVLIDVYTDWCGWCKRMDRDVYSRADVRRYLADSFVIVRLDGEGDEPARYEGRTFTSRTLAARFRVSGYPTTVFLKPGGDHIVNVPGYVPGDRFLLLLRYVGDGHLARGESFEAFVKAAK